MCVLQVDAFSVLQRKKFETNGDKNALELKYWTRTQGYKIILKFAIYLALSSVSMRNAGALEMRHFIRMLR